jgi:hypothetical protein
MFAFSKDKKIFIYQFNISDIFVREAALYPKDYDEEKRIKKLLEDYPDKVKIGKIISRKADLDGAAQDIKKTGHLSTPNANIIHFVNYLNEILKYLDDVNEYRIDKNEDHIMLDNILLPGTYTILYNYSKQEGIEELPEIG